MDDRQWINAVRTYERQFDLSQQKKQLRELQAVVGSVQTQAGNEPASANRAVVSAVIDSVIAAIDITVISSDHADNACARCFAFAGEAVFRLPPAFTAPALPVPFVLPANASPGVIIRHVFHALQSQVDPRYSDTRAARSVSEARSLALHLLTPTAPPNTAAATKQEQNYADDWRLTQNELVNASEWRLIVPNPTLSGWPDFLVLRLCFELRRGGQGQGYIPLQYRGGALPHEDVLQGILEWAAEKLLYCREDVDVTLRLAPNAKANGNTEASRFRNALRAPIYTAIRFLANRWQHWPDAAICFDWREEANAVSFDEYVNWSREAQEALMAAANAHGFSQIVFYDDGNRQAPRLPSRPKVDWVQDISLVDTYLHRTQRMRCIYPVVDKLIEGTIRGNLDQNDSKKLVWIHGDNASTRTYFAYSLLQAIGNGDRHLYAISCSNATMQRKWLENAVCKAVGIRPGIHDAYFCTAMKRAIGNRPFHLLLDGLTLDSPEKAAILDFLDQFVLSLAEGDSSYLLCITAAAPPPLYKGWHDLSVSWRDDYSEPALASNGKSPQEAKEWITSKLLAKESNSSKADKIMQELSGVINNSLRDPLTARPSSAEEVAEKVGQCKKWPQWWVQQEAQQWTKCVYNILRWFPAGADSETLAWIATHLSDSPEDFTVDASSKKPTADKPQRPTALEEIRLTAVLAALHDTSVNMLETVAGGREKLPDRCLSNNEKMPSPLFRWLAEVRMGLLARRCGALFTERSRQTRRYLSGRDKDGEIKNIDAHLALLATNITGCSEEDRLAVQLFYLRLLAPYYALGIYENDLVQLEKAHKLSMSLYKIAGVETQTQRTAQALEAFFHYYIGEYHRAKADFLLARFHFYNAYFQYKLMGQMAAVNVDSQEGSAVGPPLHRHLPGEDVRQSPAADMGELNSAIKHAICFRQEGDTNRAIWWFAIARRLVRRIKDTSKTDEEEATIMRHMASILRRLGYLPYKEDIGKQASNDKRLRTVHDHIYQYLRYAGLLKPKQPFNLQMSGEMLIQAHDVFKSRGNILAQADCLMTLAEVRRAQGIYTCTTTGDITDMGALECLRAALDKYRRLAANQKIAAVFRVYGEIFWRLKDEQGEDERAKRCIEASQGFYIRYGNRLGRARLQRLQAEEERLEIRELLAKSTSMTASDPNMRERIQRAEEFLQVSAFLYIQINMPIGFFKARKSMGDLLRELGYHDKARAYYHDAFAGLRDFQDEVAKFECERSLGQAYLDQKLFFEAASHFEKARNFFDKASMQHLEQHCRRDLAFCRLQSSDGTTEERRENRRMLEEAREYYQSVGDSAAQRQTAHYIMALRI